MSTSEHGVTNGARLKGAIKVGCARMVSKFEANQEEWNERASLRRASRDWNSLASGAVKTLLAMQNINPNQSLPRGRYASIICRTKRTCPLGRTICGRAMFSAPEEAPTVAELNSE